MSIRGPGRGLARLAGWTVLAGLVLTAVIGLAPGSDTRPALAPEASTTSTTTAPAAANPASTDPATDTPSTIGAPAAAGDLPVLRVATKALPPFVFVGEGDLRGFSVEYWNEVASRIGVRTEWVKQDTVAQIIESTRTNAVDASIAGISITAEREAVIDFSQPYDMSGHQIVTRKRAASTCSGPWAI